MIIHWFLPVIFFLFCIPTLVNCDPLADLETVLDNPNSEVQSVKIMDTYHKPEVEVRVMIREPDGSGGKRIVTGVNIHYHLNNNNFWKDPTNRNNIIPSQINTRGMFAPTGGSARGYPIYKSEGGVIKIDRLDTNRMAKLQGLVEAAVLRRDEEHQKTYYDVLKQLIKQLHTSPLPASNLAELFKGNHNDAAQVFAITKPNTQNQQQNQQQQQPHPTIDELIREQDDIERSDRLLHERESVRSQQDMERETHYHDFMDLIAAERTDNVRSGEAAMDLKEHEQYDHREQLLTQERRQNDIDSAPEQEMAPSNNPIQERRQNDIDQATDESAPVSSSRLPDDDHQHVDANERIVRNDENSNKDIHKSPRRSRSQSPTRPDASSLSPVRERDYRNIMEAEVAEQQQEERQQTKTKKREVVLN